MIEWTRTDEYQQKGGERFTISLARVRDVMVAVLWDGDRVVGRFGSSAEAREEAERIAEQDGRA